MQSEDFDKKIKEAAEHHHPVYDEKAWDKMERLLDKHMPTQKDDRRRTFFFLLLFLAVAVVSGGIYFLQSNETTHDKVSLRNKSKNEQADKSVEQTSVASTKSKEDNLTKPGASSPEKSLPVTDKSLPLTDQSSSTNSSLTKNSTAAVQKNDRAIKKNNNTAESNKDNSHTKAGYKMITGISVADQQKKFASHRQQTKQPGTHTYVVPGNKNKTVNGPAAGDAASVAGNNKNEIINNKEINSPEKNNPANNTAAVNPAVPDFSLQKKASDTTKAEANSTTTAQQKPSPKPGKQKKSAFAITFTTMPDLSTVGIRRAGKVQLGYGAGLSYTLNRFTIRSGFYVGRKVYTVGPEDYHLKYSWPPNVVLNKVNADCKVYEIPFLVSYNFAQSKKSNWFVSSGLSTYLMKRETYDYDYSYTGSSTVYWKTTTINNEYKHFFSILDLSAGYERKLNNILSITAEPYIKMPLSGIGYGKIKLNSVGIAFTLSIKPFVPKK